MASAPRQLDGASAQRADSYHEHRQHDVRLTPPVSGSAQTPTQHTPSSPRPAPIARSNAGEVGGYDAFFIDPLRDAHKCPICHLALRAPVQTSCGERFCATCINPDIGVGVEKGKCPGDGEAAEQMFVDRYCGREILALAVRCDNYLSGCDWSGQLKDLEDHIAGCCFCLVRCPNNGCDDHSMPLCHLRRHAEECSYRNASCKQCRMNIPMAGMNDHLAQECMAWPVTCPEGCGVEVQRKDLEQHRTQDCSRMQCVCPYDVYSCVFKGTREQVDRHCHAETQQHIAMVAAHSKALGDKLDALHQSVTLQQQTIAQMEEKLKASNPDPTSLTASGKFRSPISTSIDERVRARLSGKMTDIQEAIESGKQRTSQAHDGCHQLSAKSVVQMAATVARSDAALAEVDLRLLAVETNSYNGLIIFKLNNFARRHEEARTGRRVSLYSPTFYTSRHGYKFCLRVYLNGDGSGKGTHISVFLTIMKGEFDSLLEWPFRSKVTFAVMDLGSRRLHRTESFIPDPQSSSFQRPVNDMNIASGCPKMVSHSELYDKQSSYLRDDCLYIKASVDQSVCGRIEA